jgi:hypothetical protein
LRRLTILTLAAALAAPCVATAAAPAAGGAVDADARCLLTMVALSSQKDPKMAELGRIAVVYFTGRIKAREPNYDFATRLKPMMAGWSADKLNTELKRCGPQVQASMSQVEAAFSPPGGAKPPAAAAPAPAKAPPAKP